jgi:predicted unusual protein kinase regulating ubiquinone biosynthesis (AarF/ABC1/UbiB family)
MPCMLAGKFNQLVYQYPIRIPERFSLVIRSLLTQEGICLSLLPDFKFLEVRISVTFSTFELEILK